MLRALFIAATASLLLAATPSPKAKAAFDRGEKALADNLLDDAAAAYKEAIAAAPGYAAALNGLGSVLFKQGKREDAIAQFKAAIAADGQFKLAYFNLGFAARKVGDFATAAGAYEKYTQLDPNDPDGFYGLAESYRQGGQRDQAIGAYEKYLQKEKRPDQQKWMDKAKDQLAALKAEAAKPPPTQTAQNQGQQQQTGQNQTAQNQGQQQTAQNQGQKQTGQTQGQQTAQNQGQQTAQNQGQQQTGQNTAQNTAKTQAGGPNAAANPVLAQKRIADGDKLLTEKKFREASFAFQDAVNADGNNVEALFKLGNTYAVLGYYSQAIDRWNRVAQMSNDPGIKKSAQDNITKAQTRMAQLGGGSPQSQGLQPGSGPVADSTRLTARKSYEDGVKRINGRDYNGAVQVLSDAIRAEPTLTVAYIARGSANIGLRRYAEAAADYQYAIRLDSGMASPLYGLAEAYRALGRTSDAREYYERYVASSAPDVRPELQNEARMKAEKLK
ncbi:MAG: tetratricopeptide repeat protein [Myxococcaceae bacterium]